MCHFAKKEKISIFKSNSLLVYASHYVVAVVAFFMLDLSLSQFSFLAYKFFKRKIGNRAILLWLILRRLLVAVVTFICWPAQLLRWNRNFSTTIANARATFWLHVQMYMEQKQSVKKLNCLGNRETSGNKWHGSWKLAHTQKLSQKFADRIKHWAFNEKRNAVKSCEPFTLTATSRVCTRVCLCVYIFSQFHFLFTFLHFIDRRIQIKEQKIKSIAEHTHTRTHGATQSPLRFLSLSLFANAFTYESCRQIDRWSRMRYQQHNTAWALRLTDHTSLKEIYVICGHIKQQLHFFLLLRTRSRI